MLIAVIFILTALVLYTMAVFSEKIKKRLKGWMVTAFAFGLLFDIICF